jgi:hypothetical protein
METTKLNYWHTNHLHKYPWYQVAAGYWFRYPNQHSKHVFSVDTLESRIQDGKLYTRRIIIKTNPLPSWGKHFFPDGRVPVIEESIVDPHGNKLIWYTRNIGLGKFMSTVEKATLTPSNQCERETDVLKEVWIGSSIFGFRSAIKKFGIDRYKKNSILATEGFETVLTNHFGGSGDQQDSPELEQTKQHSSPSFGGKKSAELHDAGENKSADISSFGGKTSADHNQHNGGANKSADISMAGFAGMGNKQKVML